MFIDSQYGYKLATYNQPARYPSDSVIVFLHGLAGGVNSTWVQTFFKSELAENNHLLAFEYVGHGASGGAYQDLHLGHAANDLMTVLAAYQKAHPEVTKIKLVGSSFGGGVALRAAKKMPGLERIFLRCPLLDFNQVCREVERIDFAQWQKDGVVHFPGPDVNLSWAMYEDAVAHSAFEELKGCGMPLMVCHGAADQIVSIEQSHRLGRVWGKDFTLLAIEGGDHMFSNPEHFEEMIRAGVEFLK